MLEAAPFRDRDTRWNALVRHRLTRDKAKWDHAGPHTELVVRFLVDRRTGAHVGRAA